MGTSLRDTEFMLPLVSLCVKVSNWKLWVPATMINMALIPPVLRVGFVNMVFFGWSIFLSLVVNKKKEPSS